MGGSAVGKWFAAPFMVQSDCYATSLGAAVARARGPADAGFDVYITESMSGLLDSAIAKLPRPLVPLNTQYAYYDGALSEPVFLRAGTVYSLILVPTSPDLVCSVSWGGKSGTYCGWSTSDLGASWQGVGYPVAVRVGGYNVPEPPVGAALMVWLAMLSLPALCRFVSRRAADPA